VTTPDSLEDARFIRNPVPLASYFHQRHKAARERLLSVVAPPFGVILLLALLWLLVAGRGREQQKYAGLRILR